MIYSFYQDDRTAVFGLYLRSGYDLIVVDRNIIDSESALLYIL